MSFAVRIITPFIIVFFYTARERRGLKWLQSKLFVYGLADARKTR